MGNYNNLIAGDAIKPITETAVVLDGQTLTAGEIVGKITASGKIKALNTAGSDGSEVPFGIMVNDVTASGSDVTDLVYIAGEININKVTSATSSPAAQKQNLRTLGIYLKESVI